MPSATCAAPAPQHALVTQRVPLAKGESREILEILQHYVTRPENILRVSWEPGQLVLFDNRITQHYAVDNYDDQPRGVNRVTVPGDITVSRVAQHPGRTPLEPRRRLTSCPCPSHLRALAGPPPHGGSRPPARMSSSP